MTPPEFLRLGYTQWREIHWTISQTDEQMRLVCKRLGLDSENAHRMCYPVKGNKSDGFFGYWIGE